MMEAAQSVEWIVASGEVDALMLEYNLIQQHLPRFNIRYRDDKSYPYLALTVGETWPRAQVMRGAKRKNVRYFGPYGHAYAIRDTLDALTRVFPVRTCSNSFFDSARPGPAPVPVLRHRPVLRALRAPVDRRHRGVATGPTSTRWATSWPATRSPVLARLERRDARGVRAPGVRAGREAPRPARPPPAGRSRRQEMVLDPAGGPRRDRPGRGRPRGRVPGVLRPRRTGDGTQAAGWSTASRTSNRAELVASFVRRALHGADRGAAAGPRAGAARRTAR